MKCAALPSMFIRDVLLLLLLIQYKGCSGVLVLDDWVLPSIVSKGDKVDLRCNYDMRGESLYSLKWYRDNIEFYRYIPTEVPPATVFVMPGLEVLDYSSQTHIVLNNVVSDTSGEFKCEVSAGPPRFTTAARTTHLQIVDLPTSLPHIYGLNPLYRVGETLNLTCESGPSSPPTDLSWIINSSPLPSNSPIVRHLAPSFPLVDKRAMSHSTLHLPVTESLLPLEVECEATVGQVYRQTNTVTVKVSGSGRRKQRRRDSSPPPPRLIPSAAANYSAATILVLVLLATVLKL